MSEEKRAKKAIYDQNNCTDHVRGVLNSISTKYFSEIFCAVDYSRWAAVRDRIV